MANPRPSAVRLVAASLLALVVCEPSPSQEASTDRAEDPVAALETALAQAERHLAENEMDAAESDFRTALLEGWLLLAGLESADGDLEAAGEAFLRAQNSASETRRPRTGRALVALRQGRHEEAIGLLRKVLLGAPDSGELRRLLAQALIAADRHAEAVQELEEALARAPEDLETAFALGSGYLRVGDVEKARELLERLAAERPIPQTHILIGRTYRDFQQWDLARQALGRALEMDPEVRRARYYLGTIELLATGRDGLEPAMPLFEAELARYPDDPMTNLYAGLALSENRRFEEAIGHLEIAADWPPTRLDALRFLGRSHLAAGHPEEAATALRAALEIANEAATPRQLGQIHYQLAQTLRRLGDVDGARTHFEAAREASTDLVDAERDRFRRFLSDAIGLEPSASASSTADLAGLERLPPEARQGLREDLETLLARCYFNLGTMLARSGRFASALDLFQSARSLDAEFPDLDRTIGVAAFNARDFRLAAEHLQRAVGRQEASLDLERMLALAWMNLEEYGRAAEVLGRPELRASDAGMEYTYALALVKSGRAQEASAVFDRLVAEYAEWPELHVLLGQAFAEEEDYESAIASLRRALALNPSVPGANTTLGEMFMRRGRLDEAEQALRAELDGRPDAVDARYLLAVVLDLGNRPEEALEALQQVLAARPDHADARYLTGKIRLASGDTPEAARHLEAAAFLAPGDSNIRYQLAQALQRLGQRERAAEQFEIYRRLKKEEQEGSQ